MTVSPIDGTGSIVPATDWTLLLSDEIELAAGGHSRRITTEMKARELSLRRMRTRSSD